MSISRLFRRWQADPSRCSAFVARMVMGLLFLLGGASPAFAGNAISDINVSNSGNGRVLVKVSLKDALAAAPATFTINNPPRIAFDFLDTDNALGKNQQDTGERNLRSYNVVQAGGRTRLVLNLTKPQGFETQVDGNTLLITLYDETATAQTSTPPPVSHFAEAKADSSSHSVKDIDFRRGVNGEGRIVIELSDSSTGIDIRHQGKNLVVDFLKTSLPRNLERRLDVNDFVTPVSTIDLFSQGETVRMVIEPNKGLWEHSAYQTDNRFILEIKPIVEDPNKLTQGSRPGYKGEKLSLNFQNVEVRSVLQVIADFTGLNIITSDTVGGNLTLRLKDVPWDQALDIIMQTKGLDMRKNGNVILIAPREELAVKEEAALKAQQQILDIEPLQTETFQLNYQKADAVRTILTDKDQKFLSKRGSAVVDARTNTLFVQDTAARLDEVRQLITRIDITVRQVLIEARIVIADQEFSRQLGARFGSQAGYRLGNYNVGTSGGTNNANSYANGLTPNQAPFTLNNTGALAPLPLTTQTIGSGADAVTAAGLTAPYNVNLPVSNPAGSLALTFLNLGSGNLINLELQALEANNRGKVVSNPRVVTADNEKAVIEQGTEIPYITPASGASAVPAIAFKKAVLSLSVTPQIAPDGKVIMLLEVKKDSVGQVIQLPGGTNVPTIDTKNVTTKVAVNNGETAVLGGIYEETTRSDVTKVPFLGDIPVLGNLFKTTDKELNKTELLIFITPRIVTDNVTAVR